jgi:hypothetical protein
MHWANDENSYYKLLLVAKSYVKDNWGSPFILAFMLLLIDASIQLYIGFPYAAYSIAVYAFYALVIGVILQLFSFLRYTRKNEADHP